MKLNLLSNPFLKTAVSQIGGLLAGFVVNALDAALQTPTGGTAEFLHAHPIAYIGYSAGVGLIHNLISRAVANVPTNPPKS